MRRSGPELGETELVVLSRWRGRVGAAAAPRHLPYYFVFGFGGRRICRLRTL